MLKVCEQVLSTIDVACGVEREERNLPLVELILN